MMLILVTVVGFVSAMSIVLFYGICPSSNKKSLRTQRVNLRFNEGQEGVSASAVLQQQKQQQQHQPQNQPLSFLQKKQMEQMKAEELTNPNPYEVNTNPNLNPTFKKLRKGTNFDNDGFEDDLSNALVDLTSSGRTKTKNKKNPVPMQIPSILESVVEDDGNRESLPLPPPEDNRFNVNSLAESETTVPGPPPVAEEQLGAPPIKDLMKTMDKRENNNPEADLVGRESVGSTLPTANYLKSMETRPQSIFRPSPQYLERKQKGEPEKQAEKKKARVDDLTI